MRAGRNQIWEDARARMLQRVEETGRSIQRGFPHYADAETGEWTTSENGDWTGSFWTGQLWLAYHTTGDERYRAWAERWCEALEARITSDTIFRSFLFYYGAALGHILEGHERAKAMALRGARAFSESFNERAGVFALGAGAEEFTDVGQSETNVDAVGAISALLAWTSEQTGDPAYRNKARQHAQRLIEGCVRSDGSVCQSVSVGPDTGEILRRYTHKGYAENSTWARAQAWGMIGYALCAQTIPEEDAFRATAVRLADWWLEHVPEDRVAFWDFDHPDIPDAERDTSATAIATAALLKLSELVEADEAKQRYRDAAEKSARALVGEYLTPTSAHDPRPRGILTQGCYNRRIGLATRHELIWGDYHLFEALQVLSGEIPAMRL